MTAILLREIFADPAASARASMEMPAVSADSIRIAEEYLALANEDIAHAKDAAAAGQAGSKPSPGKLAG